MSLTEQEIVRYSRHIILPEVGGRGQKKLKSGSVLLAGLGAAGSAAALYLAAAGIGQLTLWDPCLLTPRDLTGAIGHAYDAIGMPRARSAARHLSAINPDLHIEVLERESDVAGRVAAHEVLLASSGDWQDLMRAAAPYGVPVVLASAHGALGAVAGFGPGAPCLGCLGQERAAAAGLYPEGNQIGAVAAAAGVVGVMAATEAVKRILGIGKPLEGRLLSYDGWGAVFEEIPFASVPGCPVCGA